MGRECNSVINSPTTKTPTTCTPLRSPAAASAVAPAPSPVSATIGSIATTLPSNATAPPNAATNQGLFPVSDGALPDDDGRILNVSTLPADVPTKHAMLEYLSSSSVMIPNSTTTACSLPPAAELEAPRL